MNRGNSGFAADNTQKRPRLHYGEIASGEKAISDEVVREVIVSVHRKMAAIEMEAFDVTAAASRFYLPVRHLVIRGISDLANRKKSNS